MEYPDPDQLTPQDEYDLVIVGSGGASMCAALYAVKQGLRPVILEKRDLVGGSTGFSGGVWWVPNNHVMKREGTPDSEAEARRYFESVVTFKGKGTTPERIDAFITQAPEMIRFLEDQGMQFYYPKGWADYYDDAPGGNSQGRSLMAQPFDSNDLGSWKRKLSLYYPFTKVPVIAFNAMRMTLFRRSWKARKLLAQAMSKMAFDKLRGRATVANGGAIQARMLEMSLRRGIPIITNFATDRLIEEEGRVVGVEGMFRGKRVTVRARGGVLLNVGGFARNDELRQKFQRHPISASWTNANPGETGEMLVEAMRLGADTENLDTCVWVPTSLNPDGSQPVGAIADDGNAYPFMHVGDMASPHMMMVDRRGQRFVNEGNSYMDLGEKMYQCDAVPAFVIMERRHVDWYPWATFVPGTKPLRKWLEDGYMVRADTIEELAEKCGIDKAGLAAQVERYNGYARTGVDEQFHKGEREYDRFRGDPNYKKNPCLGEISEGPFYAVRMYPGDVGTFGGMVTDERARVLRADGSVIEGLYAAGNCTSSVMGRTYPGAGASISPSFTFGYVAAKDVSARAGNQKAA